MLLLTLVACTEDPEPEAPPPAPYSFVVLPDVQFYSLGYPEILDQMLQWVVDTVDDHDTVFVLQVGDLVHENNETEWINARASFQVLGDDVPYAVAVGNHDIDSDGGTWGFDTYFPIEEAPDTVVATRTEGRLNDVAHAFEVQGDRWLVISLQWDPSEEALAWAAQVAQDHSDHRAILLTHAYLGPDAVRYQGEAAWEQLVAPADNFSMVLNGHYTGGEAARLTSQADAGHDVHQLFFNMQTRTFAGMGYLRVMTFDPVADTVDVVTYTPWLDLYETDDSFQFTLDGY